MSTTLSYAYTSVFILIHLFSPVNVKLLQVSNWILYVLFFLSLHYIPRVFSQLRISKRINYNWKVGVCWRGMFSSHVETRETLEPESWVNPLLSKEHILNLCGPPNLTLCFSILYSTIHLAFSNTDLFVIPQYAMNFMTFPLFRIS